MLGLTSERFTECASSSVRSLPLKGGGSGRGSAADGTWFSAAASASTPTSPFQGEVGACGIRDEPLIPFQLAEGPNR
jgi:hypothetical protein